MNLRRYRRGEATATLPIVFEDVDWAELAEAYYGHPDMQELFAALASDDENDIVVAEEELASSIMVCSEVFESTAAAVPLLLDLVSTARHRRASWLWLVGMCTDPEAAFGERLPMVQAALTAHVDRVIGFLDDADSDVAAATAYALVQCTDQPAARRALAEHPDQVLAAMKGPHEGFIDPVTDERLAEFIS